MSLCALLAYAKADRTDLTPVERRAALASALKATAKEMQVTGFGKELTQSLEEALAQAKGEGPALVHRPVTPREVRL